MEAFHGTHDVSLVIFSVLTSIVAAYISIDLLEMYTKADDRLEQTKWRVLVALSLGLGIWLMHFIGMLAYQLPVEVHYDGVGTVLSLLLANIACFVGAAYIRKTRFIEIAYGGTVVGLGIASMHYLGMDAMHMPLVNIYNPARVTLSIVVAILVSVLALHIIRTIFRMGLSRSMPTKILAAIVMGSAISSMHYIGMSALSHTASGAILDNHSSFIIDVGILTEVLVGGGIILILFSMYIVSSERSLLVKLHDETELLRLSEIRMRTLLESIADSVVVINERGNIEMFNKAAEEMFGYSRDEVIGKNISILMPEKDAAHHDGHIGRYLETGKSKIMDVGSRQLVAVDKDGKEIQVDISVNKIRGSSGLQFIGVIRDVTIYRHELDKMKVLADHDPLTGLANRRKLLAHLEHSMLYAKRQGTIICLMFIDLDGFKAVNDTLGHDAGDELLRQVAIQLKKATRESDIVARLGGDEFCILMEGVKGRAGIGRLAKNLLPSFNHPFQLFDNIAEVTASIGIAMYPDDADNADDLVKNADSAMYRAKKGGKNQYVFYGDS